MKKILLKLLWVLAISICSKVVVAQQQILYSQYMFNNLVVNPAYAGSHQRLSFTALYRAQWSGLEGAPTSFSFSGHAPINRKKIALGATVFNESIDYIQQNGINLAYAYRIPLNNGIISLGLQAGVLNTRKDYSKLLLRHDGDPNFPQGEISAFMPVFGTGVFYSNDRLFAGLSVPYLGVFNRGNGETQAVDVQEVRHFILNSGYLFDLSPDVMFKPSVVVRVANGSPIEYDLNGSIILKQTYWFGLSYRHQTSLNFMTQLQITQELQMGYSFDLVTGSLRRATSGSHEIMLNYRIRSRKGDLPLIPGFF